jgi:hypothetical protein
MRAYLATMTTRFTLPQLSFRFSRVLDRKLVVLSLLMIFLNLVDALFTLRHISHGATELNPLMAGLLDTGTGSFVVVKHLLVSLSVIAILIHPRAKVAGTVLMGGTALFGLIAVWHSLLLVMFA